LRIRWLVSIMLAAWPNRKTPSSGITPDNLPAITVARSVP
jgi:hypothetical protein